MSVLSGLWSRWHSKPSGSDESPERWVVVDTETAGLDPVRDALLSIGGVAVDETGIVPGDSFEVVLRNSASGNSANITVHGIGHGAQAAGVEPTQALQAFTQWRNGAPCVGFHSEFDRQALKAAFARAGLAFDETPWLDVAPLAEVLAPSERRPGRKSLDDWLARFRIECDMRHNAAADALATAELLTLLKALGARQGVRQFKALLKLTHQQKWLEPGR